MRFKVHFKDGSASEQIAVEYPIGHRRRRAEGIPLLEEKFANNLASRFPARQVEAVIELVTTRAAGSDPVNEFMEMLVI